MAHTKIILCYYATISDNSSGMQFAKVSIDRNTAFTKVEISHAQKSSTLHLVIRQISAAGYSIDNNDSSHTHVGVAPVLRQ